jgi:hypothetical protein
VADQVISRVSRAKLPEAAADPGTAKVATRLLARFYLRFHISLILLWSFSAGLLTTKAMLWAGVHSMLWRYPVTLLVSYGAFFLGVRIWLAYVGADPFGPGGRSGSSLVDGAGNSSGFNLGFWGGGGSGSGSGTGIQGGGGDFGGGGASGSFASDTGSITDAAADVGASPVPTTSWFSGGGGGSGGGIDLDLGDDGWLVVLLLVLVAALLSSAFGAVIYLVYSAPTIMAEVAFQAMLAGGMVKSSQRWRDASWETSLFKSTWIPFTIVFVLALGTAVLAAKLFPAADSLPEVIRSARDYLG